MIGALVNTLIARCAAAVALCAFPLLSIAPAAAGTPPDACAIISKADAAKSIGRPIVAMKTSLVGPSSNCTFKGAGAFKDVVITAYRWDSVSEAKSRFDGIVQMTGTMMHPSLPLHGLGDQAQQIGPNVYVRKGTDAYVFNVIDGSIGQTKADKAIALAKVAISHLH